MAVGAHLPARSIAVRSDSDVPLCAVVAGEMAAAAGFGGVEGEELVLAVTELARNIVRHSASGGHVFLEIVEGHGGCGVQVRATDEGPGIDDVEQALVDGKSTSGGLGIGLPGVRRLVEDFAIVASATGTIVTATKWKPGSMVARLAVSALTRPFPGERLNGDGFLIRETVDGSLVAVVDGLGHGAEACATTRVALDTIDQMRCADLGSILEACHNALRRLRGAAVSLVRLDARAGSLEHVSVGNVETRLWSPSGDQTLPSANGTVGMVMRSHPVAVVEFPIGSLFVTHTDGIAGRTDVPVTVRAGSPLDIATHIMANGARENDDATVVVGRCVG
jgi:anti-sigma regulatory factor (Ser/Thr protein kinase)